MSSRVFDNLHNGQSSSDDDLDQESNSESEFESRSQSESESNAASLQALEGVRARDTKIHTLQARGDYLDALRVGLEDPPYGHHEAKAQSIRAVIHALSLFCQEDMATTITSLTQVEQDVLLKYLFAALAKPEKYSPEILMSWHDKLTEIAGTDCVMRVLSDKRSLI